MDSRRRGLRCESHHDRHNVRQLHDDCGLCGGAPVTHTVTVASSNPNSGVNISSSTLDNNTAAGGTTPFTRVFNQNATATYVAPSTASGNTFQKWQRDGSDLTTSTTASITLDTDHTMTAIYVAPTPTVYTLTLASSNPNSGVYIYVGPNDKQGLPTGRPRSADSTTAEP